MRYLIILTLILWSCSMERRAQSGLEKFQRNGGKFECNIDTIKVPVIVKGKDGVNTIEYKDSIVTIEKTTITPKWVVRFDNRRFDDSLDHIQTLYKDSLKFALKNNRIDSRESTKLAGINKDLLVKIKRLEKSIVKAENKWSSWLLFGMILGASIVVSLLLIKRYFVRLPVR